MNLKTCTAVLLSLFYIVPSCDGKAKYEVRIDKTAYHQGETIRAVIFNRERSPLLVCGEFGHSSLQVEQAKPGAPMPFLMQVRHKRPARRNRWETLLTGWDVGSIWAAFEVGPGDKVEFPVKALQPGTMRLIAQNVATENGCAAPMKHFLKSSSFVIR